MTSMVSYYNPAVSSLSFTQLKQEFDELEERFHRIHEQKAGKNSAVIMVPSKFMPMDTMILTDSKESINHTLSERNFDNDMIKQCELLSISKSIDRASSIQILHSLPIDVVSQKVLENIEIPKTDSKHIPDILSYIKTTNKIASLKPSLPNSQSKNKPTQHIQRQRIPVLSQSEVFSSSTANQNTIELPSLIRSLPPSWKLSITQKPSIQPKSKQSQIGGDDYVLSPFRPASNPFAFAEE